MLSKEKPCIVRQGLSWKHWFLFQSQSPTTILTIWLRLLARWCNTGSPTMRIFWLKKLSLSVRLHNQWSIHNLKIWLHRLICCKPRTDHFFKKWLACGLQENDSTQGKWSHNDASHKALHIKAAQGKSIKAAVSTSHNKTKKGLPFHPKYAAFVLPFPTNLRITLDWQWDPKSLWSSLPSTILIPCPFVIGWHTNTGSWIVEENSSTIQFPQCCHQHWSQLVTEVLFNQLSVQCPKHVRYVHNVVEMYRAVSGLQKLWSSTWRPFWRWFWFDRRQGERLWSVTTDQAPFFFKLRRAKIGFDAFQRKALYCETRLVLKTLIPFSESESHDHFDNLAQIAGQMVQHRLSDNENFLNLKKLSLLVSLCCTINDQSTIWKSDSTDWSSNANHKAKSAWLWLKSKLLD